MFRARGNYRLAEREQNTLTNVSARLNAAITDSKAAEQYLQGGKAATEKLSGAIQKAIDGKSQTEYVPLAIPQEILDQTQQLLGVDAANPWYWWVLGHKHFRCG